MRCRPRCSRRSRCVATGRWPRKHALLAALALFALGQRRLRAGAELGDAARRPRADGHRRDVHAGRGRHRRRRWSSRRGAAVRWRCVFLGISLSYVVGVPLGSWLGLRFGWRAPVALVALAALMAARAGAAARAARHRCARRELHGQPPQLLATPRCARTLALTLLYFTAIFCVFTLHRAGAAALMPMSPEQLVDHADAVRPVGRGRHVDRRLRPTTASARRAR